jgi:hypothetical protein
VRRTIALLIVALLSPIAVGLAPPPATGGASGGLVSTERALESHSAAVLLPTSSGGTVGLLVCPTCATERHTTDARTRYYLGPTEVPLAALAAAFATGPRVAVTVYLDVHTQVVTRVVANAPPPAPR